MHEDNAERFPRRVEKYVFLHAGVYLKCSTIRAGNLSPEISQPQWTHWTHWKGHTVFTHTVTSMQKSLGQCADHATTRNQLNILLYTAPIIGDKGKG